jgi:hypothetical protein
MGISPYYGFKKENIGPRFLRNTICISFISIFSGYLVTNPVLTWNFRRGASVVEIGLALVSA